MARNNSSNRSNPVPPPRQSLFCLRFSIFLLLAGASAASFYFYNTLTALQDKIGNDESIIESLQRSIDKQQIIIDRFNQSVTNADVQKKVAQLEQSLHQTESQMLSKLDETTSNIQILLNSTVETLDKTVKAAQAEIEHEVEIVKGDVEQYVRTTQDQFSMENSFMVYQLAGTFTILACLISMWHMTAHVRRFKRPFVQRKILAILWMSPIYSITSWLSLVFPKYEGYLAIVKDLYEAYVVYQFLSFLISVLGRGDRDAVVDLLAKHADHLEPPVRFCGCCRGKYPFGDPRALADAVLMQCQVFTMQFVFFKPVTAIGLFACEKFGYYGDGPLDYKSPTFWLKIVQNLSVFMAFSGLLKFYHAVQEDLGWCRPFPKFLCIKGIVFMTFWQSVVIGFLATSTNIASGAKQDDSGDPDIWGKQAQNFLICLEMLLFSIAHFYCFPTEEWEEGYRPAIEKKMSAGDNLAFGDFISDLKLIMRGKDVSKVSSKTSKPNKGSLKTDNSASDKEIIDERNSGVNENENQSIHNGDIESGHSSGNRTTSSGATYTSHEDEGDVDDTDDNDRSDVDNSFDIDHLSSSLKSSLTDAIRDPDETVRQAANRLIPLMEEIGNREETARLGSNRRSEYRENDDCVVNQDNTYGSLPRHCDESDHGSEGVNDANETSSLLGGSEETVGSNETASLLGGRNSQKNTVQLRPSIFSDF
mmetsp:Transcript_2911/g.5452  ORF Transcript_2911/g.5452 Transcript_2911/m.5452 type:complete len:703 (+) Transcript_2911:225-2333(+)